MEIEPEHVTLDVLRPRLYSPDSLPVSDCYGKVTIAGSAVLLRADSLSGLEDGPFAFFFFFLTLDFVAARLELSTNSYSTSLHFGRSDSALLLHTCTRLFRWHLPATTDSRVLEPRFTSASSPRKLFRQSFIASTSFLGLNKHNMAFTSTSDVVDGGVQQGKPPFIARLTEDQGQILVNAKIGDLLLVQIFPKSADEVQD